MKFMKLIKILIISLLVTSTAHATILKFTFEDDGTSAWDFVAQFIVDIPGPIVQDTNVGGLITSWDMAWTDGSTSYGTDSDTVDLYPFKSLLIIDDNYRVVNADLCSGSCGYREHPRGEVGLTSVGYTISPTRAGRISGSWDVGAVVQPTAGVPAPTTFAVLAIGIAIIGVARSTLHQ